MDLRERLIRQLGELVMSSMDLAANLEVVTKQRDDLAAQLAAAQKPKDDVELDIEPDGRVTAIR